MLQTGIMAPDFTLLDQNNEKVSLSSFLGKKVIIYFYPKDDTPGCTTQACTFRDNYDAFKNRDLVVIGISPDSVLSHQQFITKYQLPFILLSDPEREVISKYEVWVEKVNFGKKYMGVNRSTYIIDEKGVIIKVFKNAKPDTNAEEIITFLDK
mgnify:CR=1 FL=1